jgi:hypothetical protein
VITRKGIDGGSGWWGGVVVDRKRTEANVPGVVAAATADHDALPIGAAVARGAARSDTRGRVSALERKSNRMVEPPVVVGRSIGRERDDLGGCPVDADPDFPDLRYRPRWRIPSDCAGVPLGSCFKRQSGCVAATDLLAARVPLPGQSHPRCGVPVVAIVAAAREVTDRGHVLRVGDGCGCETSRPHHCNGQHETTGAMP